MTPKAQDSKRIIAALEYLQAEGLGSRLLREMHPTRKADEGFGQAIAYRKGRPSGTYKDETVAYHHRLLFVAEQYRKGAGNFDTLVAEAIARFPRPEGPGPWGRRLLAARKAGIDPASLGAEGGKDLDEHDARRGAGSAQGKTT